MLQLLSLQMSKDVFLPIPIEIIVGLTMTSMTALFLEFFTGTHFEKLA